MRAQVRRCPAEQPESLTIVVRTIAITADGQSREVRTAADTVGQALDEIGVALSRLDRVSPAPDKAITEGVRIRVERVTRRQETEDVTVEGRTVVLGDPEQPAGYTKILERGGDGLVTRITRVWEKDGQPTKKGVVKEKVIIPARDTVVLRGTRWRAEPRRRLSEANPNARNGLRSRTKELRQVCERIHGDRREGEEGRRCGR